MPRRRHIQPLLPAEPGCQVIVTSRHELDDLPGAHRYRLDVLPVDDAIALFAQVAESGHTLPAADLLEAVQLCGCLPLAIHLAATRLRTRQVSSIGTLIEELRNIREDVDTELAATFEMSYRDLPPNQQRLFRLAGISPIPELTADVGAALANIPQADALQAFERLAHHSLLSTISPERFQFHDLIRHYASTRSDHEDPEPEQRQAIGRVLHRYLHQADLADRLLYPHRHRSPKTHRTMFKSAAQAQEWMRSEWRNLFRLVRYCAEHEWCAQAIELANILASFFDKEGRWEEARTMHQMTLKIAQDVDIDDAIARAHLNLAVIHWRTGHTNEALDNAHAARIYFHDSSEPAHEAEALDTIGLVLWALSDYRAALAYFGEAGDIYHTIGDTYGQATCHLHVGMGLVHTGRYPQAIGRFQQALAIYHTLGHERGQALAMNNIADAKLRLGYHRDAEEFFTKSDKIYRSITGRRNKAILDINFGNIAQYRGNPSTALKLYRKALAEFSTTGDRFNEANVLNNIGFACTDEGRYEESLGHHRRALSIAEQIGNTYEKTRAILGSADADTRAGRDSSALTNYQKSHNLAKEIGDPYLEARALSGIAEITRRSEGPHMARIWRQARDLFSQLGTIPELETVQIRLQVLELTTPNPARHLSTPSSHTSGFEV